jgi:hypothetical protein
MTGLVTEKEMIVIHDFEEIRDRAQALRHRELKRLFGVAVQLVAVQTSRSPSFAAAYTASVRLLASSARSTEER